MASAETKSYYLGLTIGPIIKTLMIAQKTRHLWAASYSFAYLMKEIAKTIDQNHPGRKWFKPALGEQARQAFLPAQNRTSETLTRTGAGIFPDHLILSSPDVTDIDNIKNIARQAIEDYAGQLSQKLGYDQKETGKIKNYLLDYFQVNIIRKAVTDGENPILEISKALNVVEKQQWFPVNKESYLTDFFHVVTDSFLTRDAFGKKHPFQSIPEIALTAHLSDSVKKVNGKTCAEFVEIEKMEAGFTNDETLDDEDKYVEWVKKFINDFNYEINKDKKNKEPAILFFTGQKYIAIVQADGDGIGKLLGDLPKEKLADFSMKLSEFSVEAADLVMAYNGMPVYFGGDDALFFAPVVNGKKNIFQLLRALNEKFTAMFGGFSSEHQPTLSFGLSVSYNKFPMYEALNQSGNLLRGIAKEGLEGDEIDLKTQKKKRLKNNLAFRVLRHSGSAFGGMIHQDKSAQYSVWNAFVKLFEYNLDYPNQALRSIIYRIPENKEMFKLIGKDENALFNFLDNSFDEDIHRDRVDYIRAVAELIYQVYTNFDRYPSHIDPETFESPDRIVYSLLKTIAFLTTTEN